MAVAFLKFGASKCPTLSFKPQRKCETLGRFSLEVQGRSLSSRPQYPSGQYVLAEIRQRVTLLY